MIHLDPWVAKAVILAATVSTIAIRAPHGRRSRTISVVQSWQNAREVVLLTFAWIGFLIPLVWVVSPAFSFAEYPLHVVPFVGGVACLVAGLWWFYRSHADLGAYWSVTLEVRENHQLVTHGIYQSVRHPMYSAFFVYGIGQALVLPNWVAGPVYLLVIAILFSFRVGPEEKMMLETFGDEYTAYMKKTKRLVPRVW
jgi:protein-S-isoprenylcysteine O-methyltransferase Ste14